MKELENLPPFYVGQKVIGSGKVPGSRIKKDHPYTIRIVHYSESGNPLSPPGKKYWYVGIEEWPEHNHMAPYLFVPVQENPFPLMKFKEIVKKEESQILIDN